MRERSGKRRRLPEAARRRGRSVRTRRRARRWRIVGAVLKWSLVGSIWAAVAVAGLVVWYGWDLPDIGKLATPERRPMVTLTTADGTALATYGDLYGGPVTLEDVPPYLVQAVIATEDRRFFEHSGIDPWAVARAVYVNLRSGTIRQGGSTITQQLAKNLFLTRERTVRRKVQEVLAALWLEAKFTKLQILTIYLNRVYLGAATYGVEAASRRYFGKPVREVSLHEAAVLAGLLKAPARYSPARSLDVARGRAAVVLRNMVDAGYLDAADAELATRQPLRLPPPPAGSSANYFADWVLERAAGYAGGGGDDLVIVTTLDARLQRIGEARLSAVLDRRAAPLHASQGALVALSPDGAVRAMVGGRDYGESQFNRATQALRQPGSAFKLFVYLAGLETGLTPDDIFVDGPISIGGWRPKNYDRRFRGTITLRNAFARSVNSVAVQVSERAGRGKVISAARRLGLTTAIKSHPSLALGTSEATLLELTAAYAALANQGWTAWPYGILEIRNTAGKVLYRRSGSGGGRVVEPEHVATLNRMLGAVIEEGTGRAAAIDRPAAGKTGTSQDFRDAWFIGYTADLVAGVWIGNDDGTPMKRVTGGGLPAMIWSGFMAQALKGRPARPLGAAPPWADPDAPEPARYPGDNGRYDSDYSP